MRTSVSTFTLEFQQFYFIKPNVKEENNMTLTMTTDCPLMTKSLILFDKCIELQIVSQYS